MRVDIRMQDYKDMGLFISMYVVNDDIQSIQDSRRSNLRRGLRYDPEFRDEILKNINPRSFREFFIR